VDRTGEVDLGHILAQNNLSLDLRNTFAAMLHFPATNHANSSSIILDIPAREMPPQHYNYTAGIDPAKYLKKR
jgi:hypothetical protein